MKLRKNAKPCYDPMCDRCPKGLRAKPSTHRIQVADDCIWQWLCDDHTRMAIIANSAYLASEARNIALAI